MLSFLCFHFHFFKDLRTQLPPANPERRRQLIDCEVAYIVIMSIALLFFTIGVLVNLRVFIIAGTSA